MTTSRNTATLLRRFRRGADTAATPTIAYVMTHHPRVALSFISAEIDELTRTGTAVVPIAMNAPDESDQLAPGAAAARAATTYLKANRVVLALAVLKAVAIHPVKMTRLTWSAARSGGSDVRVVARRLAHLAASARVQQVCARRRIGHIHAQFGLAPATIAWFATEIANMGRNPRTTWSFTIHGFHDFVDEHDARLDLKARDAAFVVCVSDFTRSQLCRVADPDRWDRFYVIRCGIDLAEFPRRQPRPLSSPARILVVARLSPEKGHSVLLRAVKELDDRGIAVAVEIVGAGPSEAAIRADIVELGIDRRVTLLGELTPANVVKRLEAADVFCLPSFSEGLPVSIMEAMAVGVPVVTTTVGGITELAIDGRTALTVPPSNSDALADALARLIDDDDLRDRLADAARGEVESRHYLATNVAELAAMFHATI